MLDSIGRRSQVRTTVVEADATVHGSCRHDPGAWHRGECRDVQLRRRHRMAAPRCSATRRHRPSLRQLQRHTPGRSLLPRLPGLTRPEPITRRARRVRNGRLRARDESRGTGQIPRRLARQCQLLLGARRRAGSRTWLSPSGRDRGFLCRRDQLPRLGTGFPSSARHCRS